MSSWSSSSVSFGIDDPCDISKGPWSLTTDSDVWEIRASAVCRDWPSNDTIRPDVSIMVLACEGDWVHLFSSSVVDGGEGVSGDNGNCAGLARGVGLPLGELSPEQQSSGEN